MKTTDPSNSPQPITEREAAKLRVPGTPCRKILPRVQTSRRVPRYHAGDFEAFIKAKMDGQ